ncbi:hypothetical protein EDF35_2021 [Rathayibacter sp. PhB151]|uniref:hypothetical protein n=1 Tax=Rathayibacter sp. PhB151 TaxID=2485189 RepID=UPI00106396B5|nr:hypothetical protein [Rathayibacter sp. PhB151]TDX78801.1 hypothetical protein EDF35_2021 [Rathayibacter sp. PhB151]
MTEITLTKKTGGHDVGHTIDVSTGAAEYLTNASFTTDSDTEPTVDLDGLDNYTVIDQPTDAKSAASATRRRSSKA